MRTVSVRSIQDALYNCIRRASFSLGEPECKALEEALQKERNGNACSILSQLIENHKIASSESRPLCQDTGVAVVFIEIGQEVSLSEGFLPDAVQKTVATAYDDLYLRKSIVRHPLDRVNTKTNTPAILHASLVLGDKIRIRFAAKGGGCENMSRIAMLPPSAGRTGVVDFVVETVKRAGGNPCPPLVVGVGLGGNFEKAALLAKQALLRPLGQPADIELDRALEGELLVRINNTEVGPMGLGGRTTALAVHVESHPCHIASLPVAVNLDCHSHRHAEAEI